MIVDWAVYENGKRLADDVALADALETGRRSGGFTWVGLFEPTPDEFEQVADAFDLHPLAVEDAIHAHQRPKLERYGDTLFLVLKPARYVDSYEVIEVGEIMLFVGIDFVVAVRHGPSAPLADVRRSLEEDPDRLTAGPAAVLHAVADRVVDEYAVVLRELDRDIDEIEDQVFSGPRASHSERIFKLKREVVEFRRAVDPLARPLQQLPFELKHVHADLPEYFRDVHDHVLRVSEHLGVLDNLLDSALNATVAQVGMRQNEDMRKISGWVAIVAVPTMIAGIYGMNFEYMPELEWRFGYPLVLALMATASFALYRNFKRRNWL